jgi:hypothetical protein
MPTWLDPVIRTVAVLVTVGSAIFAVFVGKRARKAAAANAFREAVHKELQGLYPRPSNWPKGTGIIKVLEAAFPKLQVAVANFKPFVTDKEGFEAAWAAYRNDTTRDIDHQSYTQYMNIVSTLPNAHGGQTVLPNDGQAMFKRHVDKLLSFAPET